MFINESVGYSRCEIETSSRPADKSQSQLALAEIASVVVHEVRQPISAIVTNGHACLHWLEKDEIDRVKLRYVLGQMIMLANLASETVDRMKDTIAGRSQSFEVVDIRATVCEAIELVKAECDVAKIELLYDFGATDMRVLGDYIQLRQVFLNLLANAIDAVKATSGKQRTIDLHIRAAKGRLSISVADTGAGIDRKISHRIFESHFSTKKTGIGMGLSICRTIVNEHDGYLEAGASRFGGALFTVDLPLYDNLNSSLTSSS